MERHGSQGIHRLSNSHRGEVITHEGNSKVSNILGYSDGSSLFAASLCSVSGIAGCPLMSTIS
jgi:hypothetical protein